MSQYEDLLIDALLDDGFTLDEAVQLIKLQERTQNSYGARVVERPSDFWRVAESDYASDHMWN
jgi:hypothetical protein